MFWDTVHYTACNTHVFVAAGFLCCTQNRHRLISVSAVFVSDQILIVTQPCVFSQYIEFTCCCCCCCWSPATLTLIWLADIYRLHVVVVSDVVHQYLGQCWATRTEVHWGYELKEGLSVLKVTHYLLKMTRNSHECTWNLCVGVCSAVTWLCRAAGLRLLVNVSVGVCVWGCHRLSELKTWKWNTAWREVWEGNVS